jgi:hypothetical protein
VETVEFLRRYRWPLVGAGFAILVVAFLAFRPDKLFVDDVVDEDLASAFATPVSDDFAPEVATTTTRATTSLPGAPATTTTTAPPTTTEPPAPSEPVVVKTGAFFGIDHAAEGTAAIYEQAGRHVLRFEDDTDIQNGPDLYVWVLPSAEYEGGTPTEYIDLGKIKGNVGGQNYELPDDFDPTTEHSVLIWCLRFNTPFAAAPLA